MDQAVCRGTDHAMRALYAPRDPPRSRTAQAWARVPRVPMPPYAADWCVKRTARGAVVDALMATVGVWVNAVELMAQGGRHEATRRVREIRADPPRGYRIERRRTPIGRWQYRVVPDHEDTQMTLWQNDAQTTLWE